MNGTRKWRESILCGVCAVQLSLVLRQQQHWVMGHKHHPRMWRRWRHCCWSLPLSRVHTDNGCRSRDTVHKCCCYTLASVKFHSPIGRRVRCDEPQPDGPPGIVWQPAITNNWKQPYFTRKRNNFHAKIPFRLYKANGRDEDENQKKYKQQIQQLAYRLVEASHNSQ